LSCSRCNCDLRQSLAALFITGDGGSRRPPSSCWASVLAATASAPVLIFPTPFGSSAAAPTVSPAAACHLFCCSVVLLPAHESAAPRTRGSSSQASLLLGEMQRQVFVLVGMLFLLLLLIMQNFSYSVSRTYFRAGSVCPENLAQMPRVCHFE
jgi:uncharacterized integral membrane protein